MPAYRRGGSNLGRRTVDTSRKRDLQHQPTDNQPTHNINRTRSISTVQDQSTYDSFSKQLNELEYVGCVNCSRLDLINKVNNYICSTCKRKPTKFSLSNNMMPTPQPQVLQNLTKLEQMLIAKMNPVMSVYQTKAFGQPGQYHYKGNIINIPQDLNDITNILPRTPSTVSVLVVRREGVNGMCDFRVRRQRVHDALTYLISNHKYYSDVIINEQTLSQLPVDGNMATEIPFIEEGGDSAEILDDNQITETSVPIIMQQRQENTVEQTINWPAQSQHPVNEYATEGYVTMSFPHLFPDGNCGLVDPSRNEKVTLREWAEYLLRHKSKIFAQDPRFRFFCLNTAQRHDSINRSMIFAKKNDFTGTMQHLRDELLRDRRILTKLLSYGSTIRGTSSFWYQRCNELKSMVNQLGIPTIFLTLSAADLWWPCLVKHFGITNETLASMNENQIAKLMQKHLTDNPLVADEYFAKRVDLYMKLLKKKFSITDFWYRYEYQHRGSPHVHAILWIEGAPDVRTFDDCFEEDLIVFRQYYDALVSAINPSIDEPPAPIHPSRLTNDEVVLGDNRQIAQLVNRVQRHTKHSVYCIRTVNRKEICRFDFPKALQEDSSLTRSENGIWEYKPKRNDPLIDEHNKYISQTWRANTDCKIIVDPHAMVNYLAKYAAKGEPTSQGYCDIFKDLITNMNDDEPAKKAFSSMLIRIVGQRDISSCEVMHNLIGEPFYHSSRQFVKMFISVDDYNMITEDSGEEFVPKSLIEQYGSRGADLENMLLKEFATNYCIKRGRMVKCRKPRVLQIVPYVVLNTSSETDEIYYKQRLLLNLPWRGEANNLKTLPTWKETFFASQLTIWELPETAEAPAVDDVIETPENDQHDWMAMASTLPNQPIRDTVLGHRDLDRDFNWYSVIEKYPGIENQINFIKRSREENSNTLTSSSDTASFLFNVEQTSVLDHFDNQLSGLEAVKLTLVQGGAGTGKSCIIREMVRRLEQLHGSNSYVLMAPTGVAANNINGKTIHTALHLTLTRNGIVNDLSGESERSFQEKMKDVKLVVCDEMSMIGLKMMAQIDKRLRQAFPEKSEEAFGGILFYLFGDFYQLPPVGDTSLLGKPREDNATSIHGKLMFSKFTKVFKLQTIMRQIGEEQIQFRQTLGRLATGTSTEADYNLLKLRFASNIRNYVDEYKDVLRLKAKKDEIISYNQLKLRSLGTPVSLIHAAHNNVTASKSTSDEAQGLESLLWLSPGCRIMLTQNLWTGAGLCNGTLGTVVDIVYKVSDINNHLYDFPLCVMVKFDGYTGPTVYDGVLPISAQTVSFKKSGVTCTRKQFPLRLAYAITIHKSQGITLDKAVVDIGNSEFGLGLTYVGLSRVKTIEGLVIDPSFPQKRLLDINKNTGWMNKREAMDRLTMLSTK